MNRLITTTLVTVLCLAPFVDTAAQGQSPHIYRKVVVLCIGIEQYQHITLPPAPGTVNDAMKLGSTLANKYGYSPEYMIGPQATREAVIDRLKSMAGRLGPEDVLIVFFAGHGQVVNLSGITAGPGNGGETIASVTASSNTPLLIPNPIAVTYTTGNTTGSLSFTPAANASGSASPDL